MRHAWSVSSDEQGLSQPAPASAIAQEIERCRRYERTVTLVRVVAAGDSAPDIARRLRRTDQSWSVGKDLVVLLPETGRAGAARAIGRWCSGARVAVAVFPEDALTVHGLIRAVRARRVSSRGAVTPPAGDAWAYPTSTRAESAGPT